ncbi:MAG: anthrax toxin-like adenylyl cyclase domain-containing protein [Planctomycetota bacterium]
MVGRKKNKILPETRIPTFPRKEVYFDKKQLEAFGFPSEVSEAFLRTADDTNCVVMSRAPGGAGTELIRDGYDLKGFLIKAKSCSWGPMAGFLCQIPTLNKYGSKMIVYNYKNHKKYLEYRKKHNILKSEPYIPLKIHKKRTEHILKSATSEEDKSGFLQQGFFERLDENTVAGLAFVRDKDKTIDRSVVAEFLMVRSKKSGKSPELWSLYHGNILYRLMKKGQDGKAILAETGPYNGYFDLFAKKPHPDDEGYDRKNVPVIEGGAVVSKWLALVLHEQQNFGSDYQKLSARKLPAGAEDKYKNWLKEFDIKRPDCFDFYPICGAQNPYPPYGQDKPRKKDDQRSFVSGVDDRYKNAVTGDYDLFAVWPVKPPVGWEMLARLAEQQFAWTARLEQWKRGADSFKGKGKKGKVSFFLDRAGKAFSLELRASPDVFVEVIPGFAEIGAWESEELGNINDATALVASSLNDTVSIAAERRHGGRGAGRVAPNMAFHSDEGGRPGIDEVDYPFAVFLPKSLFERLKKDLKKSDLGKDDKKRLAPTGRMLLIDKPRHDDFLDLACMLREKCYLLFNHVWLMQMFVLLCKKDKLKNPGIDTEGEKDPKKVKKDREKYFNTRLEERALKTLELERMKARLTELFIGSQLRTTHTDLKVRKIEQAAAKASLANLAVAFQEIAAKDLEGDMGTVERIMDRLRKAMINIPVRGEKAKIPNPRGTQKDA